MSFLRQFLFTFLFARVVMISDIEMKNQNQTANYQNFHQGFVLFSGEHVTLIKL